MTQTAKTADYYQRTCIKLSSIPGFGPVSFDRLYARMGEHVFRLFERDTVALRELGFSDSQITFITRQADSHADQITAWRETSTDNFVIARSDPDYPVRLAETSGAPLVLYGRGNVEALNAPQLAVVGSRKPSVSGSKAAQYFARQLVAQGWTVTSGLALGIDAISHKEAIRSGGRTVAVLGSGADVIYPRRHQQLAESLLAAGGTLVSELRPGTGPLAQHFPRRNRIITGLSVGTLVVEAAIKSGSLISAKTAAEQGRDVFAVPGSIFNPMTQGCHWLIQQGAKLTSNIKDIIEEYGDLEEGGGAADEKNIQKSSAENLAEHKLLDSVGFEATALDVILERSAVPINDALPLLTEYELRGLVAAIPGGYVKLGGK